MDGLLLQVGRAGAAAEAATRRALSARGRRGSGLACAKELGTRVATTVVEPPAPPRPARPQMRFCRQLPTLLLCFLVNMRVCPAFCQAYHLHLSPARCLGARRGARRVCEGA